MDSLITCNKPAINFYCQDCERILITKDIDLKKDWEPTSYNKEGQHFVRTPEQYKCNYRFARGEYKGSFCDKNTNNEDLYCDFHIKSVLKYNKDDFNIPTGFCQMEVSPTNH